VACPSASPALAKPAKASARRNSRHPLDGIEQRQAIRRLVKEEAGAQRARQANAFLLVAGRDGDHRNIGNRRPQHFLQLDAGQAGERDLPPAR
jgi:hypothetical protein